HYALVARSNPVYAPVFTYRNSCWSSTGGRPTVVGNATAVYDLAPQRHQTGEAANRPDHAVSPFSSWEKKAAIIDCHPGASQDSTQVLLAKKTKMATFEGVWQLAG